MCRNHYRSSALLSLVALASLSFGTDFWVIPKKAGTGIEKVAESVSKVGKLVGRDDRHGRYRVRVDASLSDSEAITRLSRIQLIAKVTVAEPPLETRSLNLTSVSTMERRLRQLMAIPKPQRPKTAYLQAWLYYTKQRAFPFDTVDWDAIQQASTHRDSMPPASLYGKSPSSTARASTEKSTMGDTFGPWEYVGPKNLDIPYRVYYGIRPLSGRVNAIAYHPTNANTFYLAGATGGLWKTTDKGVTWTCLSDTWEKMPVGAIAIDPKNPQKVYCGTGDFHGWSGYSIGLMKSTDGGATWTNYGRAQFGNTAVSQVLVDPDNTNIVTVTTGRGSAYNGKVYRSTDGGETWSTAINVSAPWSDCDFGAKSGSSRTYYAAAEGRIYRSNDNGATWTSLALPSGASFGGTVDVAASKIDPATVYVLSCGDQKIFKSTNRGDSWTDITGSFPGDYNWSQSWYDYHITTGKRGSNDLVFVGLIDIVYSPDGGATWTTIGGPTYSNAAITHNDQHSLGINPNNDNEILVGNDGGIFLYTWNGSSWTSQGLNRALGITQFYQADWHPSDPTWMIGGTQDNATPMAKGDLSNWYNVGGGDGGFCAINPQDPNNQYCTSQGLGVYSTNNAWLSTNYISPNTGSDNVAFIAPIEIDQKTPRYLYAGTNYIYRWDNTTRTWTARLGNQKFTNDVVSVIRVAPSDSARIYVGTSDGSLWMSTNSGANWTNITDTLPRRYITSISISRENPADVLVGFSGTGTGHLYRCTNTSAATRTWSNVSGVGATGLPDIPLNCIARDYTSYETMWFVGTDVGVFMTTDGGSTWGNATAPLGLPNVQVNAIGVSPGTGYLYAATWGRGMWRLALPTANIPVTGLTLTPSRVAGGMQVTGTVTIGSPAYPGGTKVTLASSNRTAASVPATIKVPSGQTSTTFTFTTKKVTAPQTTTITATIKDSSQSADLTVNPPGLLRTWTEPTSVEGGSTITGYVELGTEAPEGGALVRVAVDQSKAASVNWQVVIPEGESIASFPITTFAVDKTVTVSLRAAYPGPTRYTSFTVTPTLALSSISAPASVKAGQTATGTVTMNTAAKEDTEVQLTSSIPGVASVPATVTIAKGETTASFTITTSLVTSTKKVTLTASYGGKTKSVVVQVKK